MRYLALACDFDGTLAWNGQVDDRTVAALERARESGRSLILVTGREMDDLSREFPHLDLFDRVVAENGAVVYQPATGDRWLLGSRPPEAFIHDLRRAGVAPLSVGDVIVATWHPHESAVLRMIEKHGLDYHVVFNKGAVMVIPAGVDKASGLMEALHDLWISPRNCVVIGDAENDQAMFRLAESAVAVDNALVTVKDNADIVTDGDHGRGVVDLIDQLLDDDLAAMKCGPQRHAAHLGLTADDEPVYLPNYGTRLLFLGTSGSGKSWLAGAVVQQLMDHGYQVCVIDPEGDHEMLPGIIPVGDATHAPTPVEVSHVLEFPTHSVAVNLMAIPFDERPAFLKNLCPLIRGLQKRSGRPHWLVVDEAHHLLPGWADPQPIATACPSNILLATIDPVHLSRCELAAATAVVVVDPRPGDMLRALSDAGGPESPALPVESLEIGEGLAWFPGCSSEPARFRTVVSRTDHRRHRRKYAAGDVGYGKRFYFRGPAGRQDLAARNLIEFIDVSEMVDDAIWHFHLRRGDFSNWIRGVVKDEELADEFQSVEARIDLPVAESRRRICEAIRLRYTLPA